MVPSFIYFILLLAIGHTIGAANLPTSEFVSPGHRWPRIDSRRFLRGPARDLGDLVANSARDTPELPAGLPYAIVPPSGGRQDPGNGVSLISLLFDATLSWDFVINSPTTAAQIFATMPASIANATSTSGACIYFIRIALDLADSRVQPTPSPRMGGKCTCQRHTRTRQTSTSCRRSTSRGSRQSVSPYYSSRSPIRGRRTSIRMFTQHSGPMSSRLCQSTRSRAAWSLCGLHRAHD
jgi:hypothetical protein